MLAIVGGSGFNQITRLERMRMEVVSTPYGHPSAALTFGRLGNTEVVFLPRHGSGHTIPPHKINYQANIWALHQLGVRQVIALAAVGGIHADAIPGRLVIPDQLLDYTYGRAHTFFEDGLNTVTHADFTDPYDEALRQRLIRAGLAMHEPLLTRATYGATQGPRLETRAEVLRLERDGCDVVGMTGMPEAALARELNLPYACCAFVVNWAAGKSLGAAIHSEIEIHLRTGMKKVMQLLTFVLDELVSDTEKKPTSLAD